MDEKITIIEGPPPVFETVSEGWTLGLTEGPILSNVAITRLRTFNGPALVERCHRAWRNHRSIQLEFREENGLVNEVPIVAARYIETPEGHVLLLWVRFPEQEVELELDSDDDLEDEDDSQDWQV